MINFFYNIDVSIFYFINQTFSTPFLDKFFITITLVDNWFIAYLILWGILFFKGGKRGKIAAILIILLVVMSDQIGFKIIKAYFERPRPCTVLPNVITPIGCAGSFSFPSNHALNNFAVATFFYLLFPNLKWILYITATLIALSRVYLGVHYPSDIIGGALIGIIIGYLFALLQFKIEDILEKRKKNKNINSTQW